MSIQDVIATITKQEIDEAQVAATTHFELGVKGGGQMNMIAFD